MLPAPCTVFIMWALHLTMTQLLLTTFGADWWGPLWTIEQCDLIEESQLAQLLDLHVSLLLHFYLDLRRSVVWASCLLVLLIPTQRALPRLPGLAFLHLVSLLSTAETLDLAWMTIHEDQHFYWSVNVWGEWCWFRGRLYWGREGLLQLVLY